MKGREWLDVPDLYAEKSIKMQKIYIFIAVAIPKQPTIAVT